MGVFQFGSVSIASDLALHNLPAPSRPACPGDTVHVSLDASSPAQRGDWIHHWRSGEATVLSLGKPPDGGYVLRAPGLADFLLDPTHSRIAIRAHGELDTDTIEHLLVDQVLPRFLAYQGKLLTHASAFSIDGRGVLILGPTGSGKSTLAGLMSSLGHALHSDDCVELAFEADGIRAMTTYPSLRLLPDALAALHPQGVKTRKMAHYSRKARVPQAPHAVTSEAFRIHAVYFLGTNSELAHEVRIRPLTAATACIGLVRHSFQLDPTDMAHMHAHLQACAKASLGLQSFALNYPRDFTRSAELVEHLVQHVQGLSPAA